MTANARQRNIDAATKPFYDPKMRELLDVIRHSSQNPITNARTQSMVQLAKSIEVN